MVDETTKVGIHDREIGKSGVYISSGIFSDEYLNELKAEDAAIMYDKMRRSDSKVRQIFSAMFNPIKSATWEVKAASNEAQDERAAAIIRQTLFSDLSKTWSQKLSEILTYISHGHAVFEVVHMNRVHPDIGPYTGLANLGFRSQKTLVKWNFDKATGKLQSVTQKQSGDVEIQTVDLPVEFLLMFFHEQEGDDNGLALLRSCYGAYKRKLLKQKLNIIGIERFSIATPMMQIPKGVKATDAEYIAAVKALSEFTSSETSYLMYPEGWEIELKQNNYDPSYVEKSIKAEDEYMSGAVLAQFLEFNIGGNSGSNASNGNATDFFLLGLRHYAENICEVINKDLIPNLMKLNFGESLKALPKLTVSGITSDDAEKAMRTITGYVKDKVITPDNVLEDSVREKLKLPVRDEASSRIQAAPVPFGQPQFSEVVKLSMTENKEQGKTVKNEISAGTEKVKTLIQEKLKFCADKYINDVMNKYKNATPAMKEKAINGVLVGGQAQFKRTLKGVLSAIASESLKTVRKEIPSKAKVKLKEKHIDGMESYKFDDFSMLPRHVQILIDQQASEFVAKSTQDLQSKVNFQFISSNTSTNDIDVLRQHLEDTATEMIEAGSITTGAANMTAFAVNETRFSFYFDPEVIDEVESFTFINPSPESEICTTLAGTTWAANDAEALQYSPPVHHGCKSTLVANLKSSSNNPKITGLPTLNQAARDSITLSEKRKCTCH